MKRSRTYEVNANGDRGYSSSSASKVADVAVAWKRSGHEPQAYAIFDDANGMVTYRQVAVTTRRHTATRLARA